VSGGGDDETSRTAAAARSEPVRVSERSAALRAAPPRSRNGDGEGRRRGPRRRDESWGEGAASTEEEPQEVGDGRLWCATCQRYSVRHEWRTVWRRVEGLRREGVPAMILRHRVCDSLAYRFIPGVSVGGTCANG
jgi:hypothetical protein